MDRLRFGLGLKLFLMVVLTLWVYGPCIFLQHHHFFPAINMPMGPLDRLISFSNNFVWPYLSIYLLMPVGPFLMNNRKQILRYAAGVVFIGLFADMVFIFWPTCCLRPGIDGTNAAYRMLAMMDNSFHAFPSLHAAFAIYSALCGSLVLRELGCRGFAPAGLWLWAFVILFAALATKQHVVADLIAGGVLGLAVYLCMFRREIFVFK